MADDSDLPLEERILNLFRTLGIDRAHIAGRGPRDWAGLLSNHPETVMSLTLLCQGGVASRQVKGLGSRLLLFSGDRGDAFESLKKPLESLPEAQTAYLSDYDPLGWSDVCLDRSDEVGTPMLEFLDGIPQDPMNPRESVEGEVDGISYRIRGTGPPLVLFPLFLAPSQWEPLIPRLSERYTTITLGGRELGVVYVLEERGQTLGYRQLLGAMFEQIAVRPDDSLLEVGCGSGAVMRWLDEQKGPKNNLMGVDINEYLLEEGKKLARTAGADGRIQTRKGSALEIPFPDNHFDVAYSVTVIEEVDADKMIQEMIRVTRPGGRVGIISRAVDMPWAVNLPLDPELKSRIQKEGGNVSPEGCADASLYRRCRDAGLSKLISFPHLTPFLQSDSAMISFLQGSLLSELTAEEIEAWHKARKQAEEIGSFFIAWPHHCAVGTKP